MGIYAGSRGALLAFACSLVIILLVSSFNRQLAIILLISSAFLLSQFDPSGIVRRFAEAGSDSSSILRLSAIHESLKVFWGHPLVGAGFGYHLNLSASVGDLNMWYPHNFISESLALGGLMLTLPLFACIFLSMRSCFCLLANSSMTELWCIAILVQAFGYATFSGHLANVPMFWIALGLASALTPFNLTKARP